MTNLAIHLEQLRELHDLNEKMDEIQNRLDGSFRALTNTEKDFVTVHYGNCHRIFVEILNHGQGNGRKCMCFDFDPVTGPNFENIRDQLDRMVEGNTLRGACMIMHDLTKPVMVYEVQT